MAGHIYIHCRSAKTLTYSQLVKQMVEGYFGDGARVNPVCDEEHAARTDWDSFEIFWASGRRPIYVERITEPAQLKELADEVAEKFEDYHVADTHGIVARVRESRQTFHFEYGELTEAAWEMFDDTERFIARHLDGIIESIEGFWNEELDQIVVWKPR